MAGREGREGREGGGGRGEREREREREREGEGEKDPKMVEWIPQCMLVVYTYVHNTATLPACLSPSISTCTTTVASL